MSQEPEKIALDVLPGPEGPSVYLNGFRIAGPKPWGIGKALYIFETNLELIKKAVPALEAEANRPKPSREAFQEILDCHVGMVLTWKNAERALDKIMKLVQHHVDHQDVMAGRETPHTMKGVAEP